MSLRRRLLPRMLAAGALIFAAGQVATPLQAEPAATAQKVAVSTDLDGALDLGRRALIAGRPDLALSIARQILASAPDNADAHLLMAAALTRSGDPAAALPAARTGYRLAGGREDRFEAAYLAAEAAAGAGRPLLAKFWLRRADLSAPSARHKAVLATAYNTVSAHSRLSFSLSAYAGPSENVNGGSLHDTFWFYGIPIPITQALPGQIWGGALQANYRISPSTQLLAQWSHGEVVLGDRARAIDPEARAADYRRDELRFGLAGHWQDRAGRVALNARASAGRRWTGGAISADFADAEVEVWRLLGEDWMLGTRLGLQQVAIPARPLADSLTTRLTFSASHRAAGLGAVTLEVGAANVDSDAAGIAWRGPVLTLGWRPALKGDRLGLDLDFGVERRDYWMTPSFDPDLALRLSLTAELKSLTTMGFTPTVTISAERTRSQVVVRDTRELGLAFGLSSSF